MRSTEKAGVLDSPRRSGADVDLREPPRVSRPAPVTLIIPALNEEAGLRSLLRRIPAVVDELIVVDGGSTDGTVATVRRLRPDAVLVVQNGRGKGDAIKAGVRRARGDIIVTMDGDGSMNPEDIPRLVEGLLGGHDFVKGSRVLPGGSSDDFTALRRVGNWALTRFADALFGCRYTDITYGFTAYWRGTIVNLDSLADGFQFEIQHSVRAARAGVPTLEVPCHEPARVGGASKLHAARDGWKILRVILGEALPHRTVDLRAIADLHLHGLTAGPVGAPPPADPVPR